MEAFILYLVKSSVWLTGFALIYLMILRNERFFVWNRALSDYGYFSFHLFTIFHLAFHGYTTSYTRPDYGF